MLNFLYVYRVGDVGGGLVQEIDGWLSWVWFCFIGVSFDSFCKGAETGLGGGRTKGKREVEEIIEGKDQKDFECLDCWKWK